VPAALGAFAGSAFGSSRGASTPTTNGIAASGTGATPAASAPPLRAITPSH
jgi:hypothetical protein